MLIDLETKCVLCSRVWNWQLSGVWYNSADFFRTKNKADGEICGCTCCVCYLSWLCAQLFQSQNQKLCHSSIQIYKVFPNYIENKLYAMKYVKLCNLSGNTSMKVKIVLNYISQCVHITWICINCPNQLNHPH